MVDEGISSENEVWADPAKRLSLSVAEAESSGVESSQGDTVAAAVLELGSSWGFSSWVGEHHTVGPEVGQGVRWVGLQHMKPFSQI